MPINASAGSSGPRLLPPAGTHVARCYQVIDLGSRKKEWPGRQPRTVHEVRISWELPDELIPEGDAKGKPFAVHRSYTLSLGDKANLRHDLQCWRGRPFTEDELKSFDVAKVLGVGCMVTVTHTQKGDATYANVTAVTALPKAVPCPPPVNAAVEYSISDHNQTIFDALPEFLKEQITGSFEWKARQMGAQAEPEQTWDGDGPSDEPDGSCPF